jgi:hypothetical protein
MKPIEKFGWFILVLVVIIIAATALGYFGYDIGVAYGVVLTVFVAAMFAELMVLRKK